jgi:hypothetical protein
MRFAFAFAFAFAVARPLLVAAPLALALLAPSARAQECGVSLDMYEDAPLVADLHPRETLDALERGDLRETAERARDALDVNKLARAVAKKRVKAGSAFGEDDIRTALAVAIVRSGGVEGIKGPAAHNKPAQKARNLEDARNLLQAQQRIHAGDPVVTTYLAEALFAVGEREQARALLEDLAAADLIVSAEGWAALAALTDGELAANARTRCAAMARDASTCLAPAASSVVAHASASRS